MNEIAGLRNPWNSCGPEVSQKPENDEDDDEKFEHERFLSKASARLTSVPLLVPLRRPILLAPRPPAGSRRAVESA